MRSLVSGMGTVATPALETTSRPCEGTVVGRRYDLTRVTGMQSPAPSPTTRPPLPLPRPRSEPRGDQRPAYHVGLADRGFGTTFRDGAHQLSAGDVSSMLATLGWPGRRTGRGAHRKVSRSWAFDGQSSVDCEWLNGARSVAKGKGGSCRGGELWRGSSRNMCRWRAGCD